MPCAPEAHPRQSDPRAFALSKYQDLYRLQSHDQADQSDAEMSVSSGFEELK